MSGEVIVVYGSTKMLEASGGQIPNNSIGRADDSAYDIAVDGANFPEGLFVLTGTFGGNPAENTVLALCARPLQLDGTNDAEVPETTRPTRLLGYFTVNNVNTLQVMDLVALDLPRKAEYYIHNAGTGQALMAGWQLRVTPRTFKVA